LLHLLSQQRVVRRVRAGLDSGEERVEHRARLDQLHKLLRVDQTQDVRKDGQNLRGRLVELAQLADLNLQAVAVGAFRGVRRREPRLEHRRRRTGLGLVRVCVLGVGDVEGRVLLRALPLLLPSQDGSAALLEHDAPIGTYEIEQRSYGLHGGGLEVIVRTFGDSQLLAAEELELTETACHAMAVERRELGLITDVPPNRRLDEAAQRVAEHSDTLVGQVSAALQLSDLVPVCLALEEGGDALDSHTEVPGCVAELFKVDPLNHVLGLTIKAAAVGVGVAVETAVAVEIAVEIAVGAVEVGLDEAAVRRGADLIADPHDGPDRLIANHVERIEGVVQHIVEVLGTLVRRGPRGPLLVGQLLLECLERRVLEADDLGPRLLPHCHKVHRQRHQLKVAGLDGELLGVVQLKNEPAGLVIGRLHHAFLSVVLRGLDQAHHSHHRTLGRCHEHRILQRVVRGGVRRFVGLGLGLGLGVGLGVGGGAVEARATAARRARVSGRVKPMDRQVVHRVLDKVEHRHRRPRFALGVVEYLSGSD